MSNGCEHRTCIKMKLVTSIKSSNYNRKKFDLKLAEFLFDTNSKLESSLAMTIEKVDLKSQQNSSFM